MTDPARRPVRILEGDQLLAVKILMPQNKAELGRFEAGDPVVVHLGKFLWAGTVGEINGDGTKAPTLLLNVDDIEVEHG